MLLGTHQNSATIVAFIGDVSSAAAGSFAKVRDSKCSDGGNVCWTVVVFGLGAVARFHEVRLR